MNSGDALLWRPLLELWSDAMIRRETQGILAAIDAEATAIVPVDDLGQIQDAVSENRWDPLVFDATPSEFPT